jgi:excisionase family DNA binding protein
MSAGGEAGGRDACTGGYEYMAAEKPGERNEFADRGVANASSASQFLTVAEVASLMRVSKMTVYRLVHNGELPAVRVGRSFRVHAKAVHEYLETSYFDAG